MTGTLGLHHPGPLTPPAARNYPAGENAPLWPRNRQTAMTPGTITPPLDTRTGPAVTKAADAALTRRAAALPASVPCYHPPLALWNAHGRNLTLMNPPMSQVRVHMPTTGADLGV